MKNICIVIGSGVFSEGGGGTDVCLSLNRSLVQLIIQYQHSDSYKCSDFIAY